MLATGVHPAELAYLALDAGLAFGVVAAVVRARDMAWLFPVHFALDVSQFVGTS
jgi:hypothetical protein